MSSAPCAAGSRASPNADAAAATPRPFRHRRRQEHRERNHRGGRRRLGAHPAIRQHRPPDPDDQVDRADRSPVPAAPNPRCDRRRPTTTIAPATRKSERSPRQLPAGRTTAPSTNRTCQRRHPSPARRCAAGSVTARNTPDATHSTAPIGFSARAAAPPTTMAMPTIAAAATNPGSRDPPRIRVGVGKRAKSPTSSQNLRPNATRVCRLRQRHGAVAGILPNAGGVIPGPALVAQRIERLASNQKAGGSIPSEGTSAIDAVTPRS